MGLRARGVPVMSTVSHSASRCVSHVKPFVIKGVPVVPVKSYMEVLNDVYTYTPIQKCWKPLLNWDTLGHDREWLRFRYLHGVNAEI